MGGFKIDFSSSGRICTKCNLFKTWENFDLLPSRNTRVARCKSCKSDYCKKWWSLKGPAHSRAYKTKKLEKIAGRSKPTNCELCGEKGTIKRPNMVFDHDHTTNVFRGWICDRCNKVLGLCRDNTALLTKMSEYLLPIPEYGLEGC